jgi:hypothetical protein
VQLEISQQEIYGTALRADFFLCLPLPTLTGDNAFRFLILKSTISDLDA